MPSVPQQRCTHFKSHPNCSCPIGATEINGKIKWVDLVVPVTSAEKFPINEYYPEFWCSCVADWYRESAIAHSKTRHWEWCSMADEVFKPQSVSVRIPCGTLMWSSPIWTGGITAHRLTGLFTRWSRCTDCVSCTITQVRCDLFWSTLFQDVRARCHTTTIASRFNLKDSANILVNQMLRFLLK